MISIKNKITVYVIYRSLFEYLMRINYSDVLAVTQENVVYIAL